MNVRPLPAALLLIAQPLLDRLVGAADPATGAALERLTDRRVGMVLDNGGSAATGVLISGASGRLWVSGYDGDEAADAPPDVEVTATLPALLHALLSDEREGLRIRGHAEVLGDLQTALKAGTARFAPERAAADLERLAAGFGLAGWLGPLEARTRDGRRWARDSATRLAEDAAVFAQRERGWLPEPGAFEAWRDDVADLRDRLARLHARVERLATDPNASDAPSRDTTPKRSTDART